MIVGKVNIQIKVNLSASHFTNHCTHVNYLQYHIATITIMALTYFERLLQNSPMFYHV